MNPTAEVYILKKMGHLGIAIILTDKFDYLQETSVNIFSSETPKCYQISTINNDVLNKSVFNFRKNLYFICLFTLLFSKETRE